MSKGDQAIEAVGWYIVDVVGIQTPRRKKTRENWLQEKKSGFAQWLSEVITMNITPKDGHGLPLSVFISWRFYIPILLAASSLRSQIMFTRLLVSWLCRQLSFGDINSLRAHTDRFWAESLWRLGITLFPFPIVWNHGTKKCKKLIQRVSFKT